MIQETDAVVAKLAADKRPAYLTQQSNNFAVDTMNAYKKLVLELITKMTDYSPLNFNTDENLDNFYISRCKVISPSPRMLESRYRK